MSMRTVYERETAGQTEIRRQISSGDDKIVEPWLFTQFAKDCWPDDTAAHLASIAKRNVRTAERWLAGEYEPPICVVFAIINKMFERRV